MIEKLMKRLGYVKAEPQEEVKPVEVETKPVEPEPEVKKSPADILRDRIDLFIKKNVKNAESWDYKLPADMYMEVKLPVTIHLEGGRSTMEYIVMTWCWASSTYHLAFWDNLERERITKEAKQGIITPEVEAENWMRNNVLLIHQLVTSGQEVGVIPAAKLPSDKAVIDLICDKLSKTGQFAMTDLTDEGDLLLPIAIAA